jgi:FMN phosphatase YigB (HAD superfamily)
MFDFSFIDLDDTLFKTYLFKEDIYNCFARCGVSREDYKKTYSQAVFGPVVGYFDYTFKKHADILRDLGYQIPDSTIVELNKLLEKNYNFEDAENFLIEIKKISRQMILLTAGEQKLQEKKIAGSGLAKYFDGIEIIEGGKSQKIFELADSASKILFVNDNMQENIQTKKDLPDIILVGTKHKVRWTEDNYEASNLPYFDTLSEVKDYVARFI